MFEGWAEYFFMIGSSAAALIGLMFVVVTLTSGRDRHQLERGKQLYTSPVVWQLGVVLFLSGGAIAPSMTPRFFGAVSGGLSLLGIGMGLRSTIGIVRAPIVGPDDNMFDMWWYGIMPTVVYVGLAVASFLAFTQSDWAASAVAGTLMALMLVSIHAEWDLVTFLAPGPPETTKGQTRRTRH
jgi:hypothetical protein